MGSKGGGVGRGATGRWDRVPEQRCRIHWHMNIVRCLCHQVGEGLPGPNTSAHPLWSSDPKPQPPLTCKAEQQEEHQQPQQHRGGRHGPLPGAGAALPAGQRGAMAAANGNTPQLTRQGTTPYADAWVWVNGVGGWVLGVGGEGAGPRCVNCLATWGTAGAGVCGGLGEGGAEAVTTATTQPCCCCCWCWCCRTHHHHHHHHHPPAAAAAMRTGYSTAVTIMRERPSAQVG
jgi:hypothetical protein